MDEAIKIMNQLAYKFLLIVCPALYYVAIPVVWLINLALSHTLGTMIFNIMTHLINSGSNNVLGNGCYVVKQSSVTVLKLFGLLRYTQLNTAEWDGRAAFYSIERGEPDYGTHLNGHQSQENYFAHERLCGVSPWGTGGGSGFIMTGISMLSGLQSVWRWLCLFYISRPCRCSWRGCDWCKTSLCLVIWPKTPLNDGAVSLNSCETWGEGTHFTFMAINHDDGTMRNEDSHSRKDQQPMGYFKNLVDGAKEATAHEDQGEQEGDEESEPAVYHSRKTWYARKADHIPPTGDRDGSSLWSEPEKAGSIIVADTEEAAKKSIDTENRLCTFDEHTRLYTLHYSTVSKGAHGQNMKDKIAIHASNTVITGTSTLSDGSQDANSQFGGGVRLLGSAQTFIPANMPDSYMGKESPVYMDSEAVGVEHDWSDIYQPEKDMVGDNYQDQYEIGVNAMQRNPWVQTGVALGQMAEANEHNPWGQEPQH